MSQRYVSSEKLGQNHRRVTGSFKRVRRSRGYIAIRFANLCVWCDSFYRSYFIQAAVSQRKAFNAWKFGILHSVGGKGKEKKKKRMTDAGVEPAIS